MSLTVTESMAVNTLLSYLVGPTTAHGGRTRGQALEAAQLLAKQANHRLQAGWRPDELVEIFPELSHGG